MRDFAFVVVVMVAVLTYSLIRFVNGSIEFNGKNGQTAKAPGLLFSPCNRTLYPEVCFSTLRSFADSREDPITITVMATLQEVVEVCVVASWISLQPMENHDRVALADCVQLLRFTVEQVNGSLFHIRNMNSYSTRTQMRDVQTWLSASLTNLHTCMDGFQNSNGSLKYSLHDRMHNLSMLISNSLAIANTISYNNKQNSDQGLDGHHRRRLLSELYGDNRDFERSAEVGFPVWMSAGDRRLLVARNGETEVNDIVAQDGTGQFRTIGAALKTAPKKGKQRYVIHVTAGIYDETLSVDKENIMLVGDGKGVTVVTGGSESLTKHASQFTATFMAFSNGFIARDLTFQNTAGPYKGQAAALLVRSDRSAFYRCSIIGYQDTLYAHSQRQFYRECDI